MVLDIFTSGLLVIFLVLQAFALVYAESGYRLFIGISIALAIFGILFANVTGRMAPQSNKTVVAFRTLLVLFAMSFFILQLYVIAHIETISARNLLGIAILFVTATFSASYEAGKSHILSPRTRYAC